MATNESNDGFASTLRQSVNQAIQGLSIDENDKWIGVAETVADIADRLFLDDDIGRRQFIGKVLGIELVTSADEHSD